jgi:hypothetical protein
MNIVGAVDHPFDLGALIDPEFAGRR